MLDDLLGNEAVDEAQVTRTVLDTPERDLLSVVAGDEAALARQTVQGKKLSFYGNGLHHLALNDVPHHDIAVQRPRRQVAVVAQTRDAADCGRVSFQHERLALVLQVPQDH